MKKSDSELDFESSTHQRQLRPKGEQTRNSQVMLKTRATKRLFKIVDWFNLLPDGPLVEYGFSNNHL